MFNSKGLKLGKSRLSNRHLLASNHVIKGNEAFVLELPNRSGLIPVMLEFARCKGNRWLYVGIGNYRSGNISKHFDTSNWPDLWKK